MRKLFSILILAITITTAAAANAGDYGGCFGKSDICAGPSLSVGLVGYNLVTHSVSLGALPVGAAGYEVTAFTSQWYRTGLSANLAAVAQQQGSNFVAVAFIASFATYLRAGMMMRTVGDSAQWTVLGGLGIGGGSAAGP
jgi:hypothetical protein